MPVPTHRPTLTDDADHNQQVLQRLLDATPGGTIELPPGDHPLRHGLDLPAGWLPAGWTLRGAVATGAPTTGAPTTGGATANGATAGAATGPGPGVPATWLSSRADDGRPVLRVSGSRVTVTDIGLCPPPSAPGEHAGDLGTAITVGRYLYDREPEWIDGVELRRVHVRRPGDRAANCIAIMGAVRGVTLHDATIEGGFTGVAVHWGAVGGDVSTITGPSYHPHRLRIGDLRVSDAVEGFYLSSVYDVEVTGACLSGVEMGFRLLAGDNTDRFLSDAHAVIGQGIEVRDACVRWHGNLYGIRVAGWGRSEVDGAVSVLRYRDVAIRDCVVSRVEPAAPAPGDPRRSWAPVLMESADGVELHDIRVGTATAGSPCCPLRPVAGRDEVPAGAGG
jgi:hypothetical protein